MRKTYYLLLIVSLIIIGLFSCAKDTSNTSKTDVRTKFEGSWNCSENSTTYGSQHYEVLISLDNVDSTAILVSNFFGIGGSNYAYATINGSVMTFPEQSLTGGYQVYGSGNISSNYSTISLTYYVSEIPVKKSLKTGNTETVTATYTKN
ncbi:MAG: hypothetical protein NTW49_09110 [Bacteroidia bacterium]|nr:hypothetical protein [Bacteroidia bacterium]